MKKYVREQQDQYMIKLDEYLSMMPPYFEKYFDGIDMKTNERTRLAYCRDIYFFLKYLVSELPICQGYTVRELPIDILEEISPSDIDRFLKYLKMYEVNGKMHHNCDQTRNRYLSAISAAYTFFNQRGFVRNNPTTAVNRSKRKKKPVIALTQDEIYALMEAIDDTSNMTERQRKLHEKTVDRNRAIISVFLGTGLRISELVGLDVSDINFKNQSLDVIRKGGDQEFVFFGDEVCEALYRYLYPNEEEHKDSEIKVKSPREILLNGNDEETALFISNHGKRMCVRSIELMVNKYCSKICTNKKITPHKLRSTYGTTIYGETGDLVLTSRLLNHKDLNVSHDRYLADAEAPRMAAAQLISLKKQNHAIQEGE